MIESISTCSPLGLHVDDRPGQARPNQHHEHRNKRTCRGGLLCLYIDKTRTILVNKVTDPDIFLDMIDTTHV